MRGTLDSGFVGALVRWRFAVTLIVAVAFSQAAVNAASWQNGMDWSLLQHGGRELLSAHALSAYARVPGLQAGPPSLLVAGVLDLLFGSATPLVLHLLLFAELPLLLWLMERFVASSALAGGRAPTSLRLKVLLAGVVLAPPWASLAGGTVHVDDGLALLATVTASLFVVRNRPLAAALCAGSAAAAKPWAVGALAVLVGLSQYRLRAVLLAAAVPVLAWLPEMFDPRNFHAATAYPFPVAADAPLRVVGLLSRVMPSWQRPVELAAILGVAVVVALRGNWPEAFAASMVARLLFEVSTLTYYDVDTLAAVLAIDVATRARPWRSGLLWVAVEAGGLLPIGMAGAVRLVALVVLVLSYAYQRSEPVGIPAVKKLIRAKRPLLAS